MELPPSLACDILACAAGHNVPGGSISFPFPVPFHQPVASRRAVWHYVVGLCVFFRRVSFYFSSVFALSNDTKYSFLLFFYFFDLLVSLVYTRDHVCIDLFNFVGIRPTSTCICKSMINHHVRVP